MRHNARQSDNINRFLSSTVDKFQMASERESGSSSSSSSEQTENAEEDQKKKEEN